MDKINFLKETKASLLDELVAGSNMSDSSKNRMERVNGGLVLPSTGVILGFGLQSYEFDNNSGDYLFLRVATVVDGAIVPNTEVDVPYSRFFGFGCPVSTVPQFTKFRKSIVIKNTIETNKELQEARKKAEITPNQMLEQLVGQVLDFEPMELYTMFDTTTLVDERLMLLNQLDDQAKKAECDTKTFYTIKPQDTKIEGITPQKFEGTN